MTSLPAKIPHRLRNTAHIASAYNTCLRVEKPLQQAIEKGEDVGKNLIYIRILGYLVHYVPTDQGLKTVIQEINSCPGDSVLFGVGKMYFDHYIRGFRANRGHTPAPSDHASRPSFDIITDMINDTLVETPQSHADAKNNVCSRINTDQALIRDGFRCVVTGKYDAPSVLNNREIMQKLTLDNSLDMGVTNCAHIFAESTNSSIKPGSDRVFMGRFGHDELPDDLNGSKVHRLENVMTMVSRFHSYFDQLQAWFVATEEENKYKLEGINDLIVRHYPEYVTFTTPDPVKFPLPSRAYLAIHAACAKIAHLSGAAECIDKFYRDMDDSKTLNPSGTSAEMLEHAIFELQASGFEVGA